MKNKYEVRGDVTVIFINCVGKTFETIIDTDDLEIAKSIPNTWHGNKNKSTGDIYVDSSRPYARLHRLIMKAVDSEVVDHIDNNTMNNKKNNLRITDTYGNNQNLKGARKDNRSSGYRNVHFHKQSGKWRVKINIKGKDYFIGYFEDMEEANEAAKQARAKYMPLSSEATHETAIPLDTNIFDKERPNVLNKSGLKYVYRHKVNNKWIAQYKKEYLGSFDTKEEALKKINEIRSTLI